MHRAHPTDPQFPSPDRVADRRRDALGVTIMIVGLAAAVGALLLAMLFLGSPGWLFAWRAR